MTQSGVDAWQPRTIWEQLVRAAAGREGQEALVFVDADWREHRVTYGELVDRSERLACGLTRLGLRRGDRLSVWMTNSLDCACVFFAGLRVGAMLVPMNTWLRPPEAATELRRARSRWLVTIDSFRQKNFVAALESVCPAWTRSRPGHLYAEELPELRGVVTVCRDGRPSPAHAFDLHEVERLGAGYQSDAAYRAGVREVAPADAAALFFTSGSTGAPKGLVLEQWGIVTKTLLLAERLELGPADRMFSPMPFFHVGGSLQALFRMPLLGGTLVFVEAHDADREIDLMRRERCTVNYSLFAVLHDQVAALERRGERLRLRWTMAVGAPASDLREYFGARMLFSGWGLSEGYSIQSCCSPDDPPAKQDTTAGRPLPGIEIRLVDPVTGAEVGPEEVGEGWVRGTVMRGYWEDPELTGRTIDAQGWMRTGDLLRLGPDGYYRYEGRIKAMIKVGGENVSPGEVEAFVRSLPGVSDCSVVGAPDPRYGEVPVAFVAIEPEQVVACEEILRRCTAALASFKVPRHVELVDALPRLAATSKVDLQTLQVRARELVSRPV